MPTVPGMSLEFLQSFLCRLLHESDLSKHQRQAAITQLCLKVQSQTLFPALVNLHVFDPQHYFLFECGKEWAEVRTTEMS